MSQDNREKENEIKIRLEAEESVEPASSNGDLSGIQDAMPDFDMPKMSEAPSTYRGSSGYNPDFKMPSSSTDMPEVPSRVPTPPVTNDVSNVSKQPGAGANSLPPTGRKESAPDIGKDYGPGAAAPGYGERPVGPERERSIPADGVPERQNPVENPVPNQVPETEHRGLDKKGGLESDEKNKGLTKDKDAKEDKDSVQPNGKDGNGNPAGNGYGSLKNKPNSNPQDSTSRARRNLEHNNQMRNGRQNDKTGTNKPPINKGVPSRGGNTGGLGNNSGLGSLGAKLRNGLSNLGKGTGKDKITPKSNNAGNENRKGSFSNFAKKALEFIIKHPYAAIAIGIVGLILIILMCENLETAGGKKGTHCTYNLSGVSASGEVKLEGLQVELINCDGTASNYTVLETVDFEKYVLGVALAEIGAESPDEAIKAQILAARGFSLTRNSGMCPGNPDGCFYGYNASTGKIRMRACEADQVYWDYEKDIYRQERGSISIYSPEINSGTLWKSTLNESRKEHVLALANEVKGKVLVDSNNKVVSTNYVASTSNQFISLANQGKTYEEILATVYSDSDGFSSGECTSYGDIDYGDYVLSSEGDEILHQPLDSFLSSKGSSLEEFSALIASNVDNAGYGTRAGVVAAAVTLIAELGNNYDVKIPYYWGGGHYDGVVDGALGYWGSTQCHTYANGQSYNYCGFDCSGFVPWAIKNGGFDMSQRLAGDFVNLPGVRKVSLSNNPVLEPGDLLESSGHIVLVIGIEESTGNYICAEASGNSSGVLFTRRSFNSSGYWGVDMTGFYETRARSK
ncbi:MAG: hypothetical protein K2H20_00805 [Bacilli bacterium]|nr:hypothetical protein [Bacilli bacterium]